MSAVLAMPVESIRPVQLCDLNLPPAKVGTGDRVMSAWGRHLSPVPTINCKSDRTVTGSLSRLEDWLIREAAAEARLRQDDVAAAQFSRLTPKTLSQSDRDELNLYLFHNSDGLHDGSFVLPPTNGAVP